METPFRAGVPGKMNSSSACIKMPVRITCSFEPHNNQQGGLQHRKRGASYKVLAVMSYHESIPWVMEIKEGIEPALSGACDIKYF